MEDASTSINHSMDARRAEKTQQVAHEATQEIGALASESLKSFTQLQSIWMRSCSETLRIMSETFDRNASALGHEQHKK